MFIVLNYYYYVVNVTLKVCYLTTFTERTCTLKLLSRIILYYTNYKYDLYPLTWSWNNERWSHQKWRPVRERVVSSTLLKMN